MFVFMFMNKAQSRENDMVYNRTEYTISMTRPTLSEKFPIKSLFNRKYKNQ